MPLAESVEAAGRAEQLLRDAIEGSVFGSIAVRKLVVVVGEDADGETALYVDLTLSDPADATWPIEDAQDLRRRIREVLLRDPPGIPFYVTLRPEHEAPQADEESEASG